MITPFGLLSTILQEINAMSLIWAFKFAKSKDPVTKQEKVYDLHDFVKVSLLSVSHEGSSRLTGHSRRVS